MSAMREDQEVFDDLLARVSSNSVAKSGLGGSTYLVVSGCRNGIFMLRSFQS